MKNLSANELRIGNLVHFIFTNETVEIVGINAHESNNKSIYNTISFRSFNLYCESFETIKPIALTEEWLLRFGYVKFDVKASIYCEYCLIIDGVLKYKLLFDYRDLGIIMPNTDKPIRLKYVHQLQNLYYALTGEELTFKNN